MAIGQLSDVFHKLKTIAMDALSVKQKEAIVGIRVGNTGRKSLIPPLLAPYDFGIDLGWWNRYAKKYPNHITDFMTHGNIEGFGKGKGKSKEGDGEEGDGEEEDGEEEDRGGDGEVMAHDGNGNLGDDGGGDPHDDLYYGN